VSDERLRAASEAVRQHLPGVGLFLIVVHRDGSISTTSNVPNGVPRLELLQHVLAREMERAGLPALPNRPGEN